MSQPSRLPATPTPTHAITTATASAPTVHGLRGRSITSSSTTLLLLTLLVLSTLFTPAASISFLGSLKSNQLPNDCETDMEVSAVCYQCAALDPVRFHDIHDLCCNVEGRVRRLCRAWYTEEPKRGRRDVWYY